MANSTTQLIDFRPPTRALADVITGVRDDQLGGPTPCAAYAVQDLIDHVAGLTVAFTAAARKQPVPSDPGSARQPDWRERLATSLAELAHSWADPSAYQGMTMAGPVELPGPEVARVALDEIVVHGWDLARATGQPYVADPTAVAACTAFVESFEVPAGGGPDGGLFGPRVPVPTGADPLDQLLGLTGRDPAWTP